MLSIQQNHSLKAYNTFGLNAKARYFIEITDEQQLQELAQTEYWELPKLILGGGSNILLIDDFDGLVIKLNTKGIEIVEENEEEVVVRVAAGENWHQFVLHTIEQGWGGVENLSLIPGCVGASPMQNIGAYGVEIEQVFEQLKAFHIQKKEFHQFKNKECEFGYRSSIFKTSVKGQYIITSVEFKLSKQPVLNTSYGAIQAKLQEMNITEPTVKNVSDAVIAIRQSKLPDPKEVGNSGSFFKNPVVTEQQFQSILKEHETMPFYRLSEDEVKIPAGWLIEQCGFKGKQVGNTGTYKNQALILVNHGNATGQEIWNFAQQIQQTVQEKFNILLEPEVNKIGCN